MAVVYCDGHCTPQRSHLLHQQGSAWLKGTSLIKGPVHDGVFVVQQNDSCSALAVVVVLV